MDFAIATLQEAAARLRCTRNDKICIFLYIWDAPGRYFVLGILYLVMSISVDA